MAQLVSAVEENVLSRHLVKRGERLLVAVSGGLDSMVLLQVLHELSTRHMWSLRVAHMNHRLRGRASDADERFVRDSCRSLRLPLTVRRADVAAYASRKKLSIEMAAREARHEFLAQTALRHAISTVALAHHADDQVELFFLRLFRGSGSEGLAGMGWFSPSPADPVVTLVRPLLDQPKAALATHARAIGLRHREDASNSSPDFLRNRMRNELLPLLRAAYQPAIDRTMLRVMDILGAEAGFVSQAAEEWGRHRSTQAFPELPVAVQRRWLQRQLNGLCLSSDFDLIEALRRNPGRPVTVQPGKTAVCGADGLVQVGEERTPEFRRGALDVAISSSTGRVLFAGTQISWVREPMRRFAKPKAQPGVEEFDADRVGSKVMLRHWRRGDRFQPIGMPSAVKLQDLFTNQKVLRKRRHELILGITERNEVFWVEGLRISERFKLTRASKCRLVWRWTRP